MFSDYATFNHEPFGMCSRSETAVLTDARLRILNEVISGVAVVKIYAWEKPFARLVTEARR